MKKITGKVVSLVLALALVVTSFSANFAFAATKTVNGSVDLREDDAKVLYLVNGGTGNQTKVNLSARIADKAGKPITMDTPDHQDVTPKSIIAVSHLSGDRLVKWGDVNGKSVDDDEETYLFLKSGSADGKEVISVLYNGTYTNDDGDEVNVKAKANITVYVADKGTNYIGKYYDSGDLAKRQGLKIEDIDSFATNTDFKDSDGRVDNHSIGVYTVNPDDGSALATYSYVPIVADGAADQTQGIFSVKASSSPNYFGWSVDSSTDGKIDAYTLPGAKAGTITFTATHTESGTGANDSLLTGMSKDKFTAKLKIDKKVIVKRWTKIGKDKKTYLYASNVKDENTSGQEDKRIDVTGCDLDFQYPNYANNSVSLSDKSTSVGKISGKFKKIDINDGSVSKIDIDQGDVIIGDAKVGDVKTRNKDNGSVAGAVTVNGGTVGNIDASGEVNVTSGTTGDIKTDASISITGNDDDKTTSVGNIENKAEVVLNSDNSKVIAKSYKATDDNAKLTVKGDKVTISKVDFDHRDNTTLSFDDFQGKMTSPVNATKATIETTNEDDAVVFTGAANVDTIELADSSKVSFDGDVKVAYVSGSGSLKVLVGKLYVSESVSGSPVLKFANDFKPGDIAFKADSDAVDVDDFNTFGYTLSNSTGTSTDTFKIATIKFAGLQIKGGNTEIAKGTQYAQTFTAVAYPTGTSIPTGDKVSWDFEGNDNYFKVTKNANGTETVEVIAVDSEFASENKGIVKAKLIDSDDNDDTDYEEATLDVTAVAVPSVISDTNTDISFAKGTSYQLKLTAPTAPVVTTGTAGVYSVALVSRNGNDYLYKLTATGNAGSATGIFANGKKLFVAKVKAVTFTSDTTKDTIVKGSYTFKITSDATPTVSVGSNAVKLEAGSKSGNNYFYKLTSNGAVGTKVGVYVNNTKTFVAVIG